MFGIGMPELLLILALAIVFIGPKKLPDLARALGRGIAEFRRATDELKSSFDDETRKATRERLVREGKIRPPGAVSPPAAPAKETPDDDPDSAVSAAEVQEEDPGVAAPPPTVAATAAAPAKDAQQ